MTLIFGLSEVSGLEIGVVKLLSIFRRKVLGLLVLAIICIATEQVIYCVITPTYLFQLLVSPVFWGSLSVLCFFGVQLLNSQSKEPLHAKPEKMSDDLYYFIFRAPLSMDNPDNLFSRNLNGW